jgi:hypothetical protein
MKNDEEQVEKETKPELETIYDVMPLWKYELLIAGI